MKLFIAAAIAMFATPALAQDQTTPAPAATDQAAPAGGYQPANPPISGTPAPGATVRFQQAPAPSEAYPAPAAKDHYPPCRKGQHNGCSEREDGAGAGIGGNRGWRHHGKHWRHHGKHWHHHHKGWRHHHKGWHHHHKGWHHHGMKKADAAAPAPAATPAQ